MPVPISAQAIAVLKARGGFAPVNLLDLYTIAGNYYYWSDLPGVFPVRLGAGPTAVYQPWVKSCGPFRMTRSLDQDGGIITLQNVSGNSIYRDLALALTSDEFEGALAVYRWWGVTVEQAFYEFDGYVSQPLGDEQQATLNLVQLFDTSIKNALDVWSEQCTWRYKEDRCGSVSSQVVCSKSFGDCFVRGAVERHNGVPFAPPSNAQIPVAPGVGNAVSGGSDDLGRGGAGSVHGRLAEAVL